jgi:hypothetical protein
MLRLILLVAMALAGVGLVDQPVSGPPRTMAITIDDLPYVEVGGREYLPHARRVTARILEVLRAHRAPAVGFVNEGKLHAGADAERRIELLRLGTGQQHAIVERVQEPRLGNPAPALDQLLVHDGDLSGPPKLMNPSFSQKRNAWLKLTAGGATFGFMRRPAGLKACPT